MLIMFVVEQTHSMCLGESPKYLAMMSNYFFEKYKIFHKRYTLLDGIQKMKLIPNKKKLKQ